jgi:hypothetical protein
MNQSTLRDIIAKNAAADIAAQIDKDILSSIFPCYQLEDGIYEENMLSPTPWVKSEDEIYYIIEKNLVTKKFYFLRLYEEKKITYEELVVDLL